MKNRLGLIILILICVGLVVALIWTRKQATDQRNADVVQIGAYSNSFVEVSDNYARQRQVNVEYDKLLKERQAAFENLTNAYVEVSNSYVQVASSLETTSNSLQVAKTQVAQRDARISDLESQNQALDQQAADLNASIAKLTAQIDDTKRKLAASEGDKATLTKELNRLMSEKAEMERQFNDIKVLRAQIAKVKEQMAISQRLRWKREGLSSSSEQKGAELLMQHSTPPANRPPRGPNYDLNVEISSDGSVRVVPPLTNSPSSNSSPAR